MRPAEAAKFACLCLNAVTANELLGATGELGGEFSLGSPTEKFDLDLWAEAIGKRRVREINESNVWIWAFRHSDRLTVTDAENRELEERMFRFWKGLLLNRPPLVHSAWILTGSQRDGVPDVATFSSVGHIFIKEAPYPITLAMLRSAGETAQHLELAFASGDLRGRVERGLTAFFGAMGNQFLDESILALERSLEGILHPNDKAQFVKRAARILNFDEQATSNLQGVLAEAYDIRSGFTHAQPVEVVFPGLSPDRAVQRAQQLQTLLYFAASRAYRAVLKEPALVRQFAAEGIGEYWGKVVTQKRPPPFVVQIAEHEWLLEHDDTRYLRAPTSAERLHR
jgi:hypothetical protein